MIYFGECGLCRSCCGIFARWPPNDTARDRAGGLAVQPTHDYRPSFRGSSGGRRHTVPRENPSFFVLEADALSINGAGRRDRFSWEPTRFTVITQRLYHELFADR